MEARQTAYKVKIADILSSGFTKSDDPNVNGLSIENKNVNRVNLFGVVVDSPAEFPNFSQLTLDDGSSRITARMFENKQRLSQLNIGDPIILIGKPRDYNGERYVVAEIIKKMNNLKWLKVRELELNKEKDKEDTREQEEAIVEEENIEDKTVHNIIQALTELDSGSGVDYDLILKKADSSQAEKKIKYLMEKGDVFEVSPGKLKILE